MSYLVDVKGCQTDQILGGLLAFGRVVQARGPQHKVELLPGLLALGLEPELAFNLGGPDPGAGEELLNELGSGPVVHFCAALGAGVS